MKVESAQYVEVDGRPLLDMVIDGKQARVGEFKLRLWEKGYVPLDSTAPDVFWDEILPVVTLEDGEKLRGCTNDPVVLALVSKYIEDVNSPEPFKKGAVTVPKI